MAYMRVTVGNLKGGVGKSMTSMFLAAGLSRAGRVLLVDADGTNRTCSKWAAAATEWPADRISVVELEVSDLARRVAAMTHGHEHVVIDTGPQKPAVLRQALLATDDLVVTTAPYPMELEQLPDTFALAAEVDAQSPVWPRVLLCKVRSGTRSSVEARAYLDRMELPVLDAEVALREWYALTYGTMPDELRDYARVLTELDSEDEGVVS